MDQLKEINKMSNKLAYFKAALLKISDKNEIEIKKYDREIARIDKAIDKVDNSDSLTLSEGLKIISEI